jgi:uncharacterized protein
VARRHADPRRSIAGARLRPAIRDRPAFPRRGRSREKPVAGLETIGFQVDLLSGLSADLQDKLVFSELVEADNLAGDLAAVVQAWRAGDTAGMEAAATRAEREHPELQPLTEAVVYQRNAAMARQIADFLKTPKTRFDVVGSLHLVGDRGILKLLADQGYRIEQMRVQ